MRLQIEFEILGKAQLLPFNYQYPLSSWIYKVIATGNTVFAEFLHNEGYATQEGKRFKLFCFSGLRFPKGLARKSDKEQGYLLIKSQKAWMDISFYLPEQLEPFVAGLFKQQEVYVGDKNHAVKMKVANITMINEPDLKKGKSIVCKTKTAVVMGEKNEDEKHEQYIPPLSLNYKGLIESNILDKCYAVGMMDVNPDEIDFNVERVSAKTVLQTIKAGTAEETKVRAFHYDFKLNAPKEVMNLLYATGIGSMNSLGFGLWDIVKN